MHNIFDAYHRTESRQDGTFVPQVQIVSGSPGSAFVDTHLRDDDHPCATREQARARETHLAERWKLDHASDDAVIAFQN